MAQPNNEHHKKTRGSGSDRNSDTRRLQDPENLFDKASEDSFPASDPPSTSPLKGVGGRSVNKEVGKTSDPEDNDHFD
jgi:hypothetical protein